MFFEKKYKKILKNNKKLNRTEKKLKKYKKIKKYKKNLKKIRKFPGNRTGPDQPILVHRPLLDDTK